MSCATISAAATPLPGYGAATKSKYSMAPASPCSTPRRTKKNGPNVHAPRQEARERRPPASLEKARAAPRRQPLEKASLEQAVRTDRSAHRAREDRAQRLPHSLCVDRHHLHRSRALFSATARRAVLLALEHRAVLPRHQNHDAHGGHAHQKPRHGEKGTASRRLETIAYNAMRALILESASKHQQELGRISFKGAADLPRQ